MSKTKRKRYSGAFKAKVGLAALMGLKTVGQIAREYQVHPVPVPVPVPVPQWKGIVRDHLPELFESPQAAGEDQEELLAPAPREDRPVERGGGLAKNRVPATGPVRGRRDLLEPDPELSLQRPCELVGISRRGCYYEPVPERAENLALMRRLDELPLERPLYGRRRLTALWQRAGRAVNRQRVARLQELMGVGVAYPKRNLSQPGDIGIYTCGGDFCAAGLNN